ncbi:MAG TPA: SPFH domain-containing protein [Candidatus Scatomorpha intestinavium]|uniref:SPFH domain-containing protein n=1 Tax=Candidatus Scatomorpha intestinavium TaxID=2840922 RepID=A0A9D0ZH29_9FIRM|nr:SPFH domain-containing protein [Candidatus Scatomorpha intestinavium]
MNDTQIIERELNPKKGIPMLLLDLAMLLISIVLAAFSIAVLGAGLAFLGAVMLIVAVVMFIAFFILLAGLKTVRPNEALVLTLFGEYHGTIKKAGYYFVNPFCSAVSPAYDKAAAEKAKKEKEEGGNPSSTTQMVTTRARVSMKTMTLDNGRQKVNDVLGNPIIIGAVVIYHVADPTKAVFNVEDYPSFLSNQTDSTVRNVARLYPYDIMDEDDAETAGEKTLRGSSQEIAGSMKAELQKRVDTAGIVVEEVRITHLAYAEEIAAAMLQRQQAAAIISARQKIVDGAVGMVKMAIDRLGQDEIVVLDEERKAAMVSNLLVVLCGNHDAQPVVNSGSIY